MALQHIIILLLFGPITIQSTSILSNGCPADFHVHRLLPHETDCDKFYQCSNGQRVLMHCAAGTLFSEELQVCVWPDQATCNQTIEPVPTTEPEPETTQTSVTEQNTSYDDDFLPNGCPKDFGLHLLLTHETDCDKFYQCSNGQKYLMQCADGTLFDDKLQICNWPHAVECHLATTNPTEGSMTQELTTDNPRTTTEEAFTSVEESTVVHTITEQTTLDLTTEKQTTVIQISSNPTTEDSDKKTTEAPTTTKETTEEHSTEHISEQTTDPNTSTAADFTTEPTTVKSTTIKETTTLLTESAEETTDGSVTIDLSTIKSTTEEEPHITTEHTTETSDITTTDNTEDIDFTTINVTGMTQNPDSSTTQEFTTGPTTQKLTTDNPRTTTEEAVTSVEESTVVHTITEQTTLDLITEKQTTVIQISSDPTTEGSDEKTTEAPTTTEEHSTEHISEQTTGPNTSATADFTTEPTTVKSTTIEETTTLLTESAEETTDGSVTIDLSTIKSTTEEEPHITTEHTTETSDITTTDNVEDIDFTTIDVTGMTQNPDSSTTQEFTTVTQSPNFTTEDSLITTQAPICPVGEFGNVPHPEKCDAFFLCSGGVAFEVACSSGFEFDPLLKVCVEISEGGCTLGSVTNSEADNINFTTTELPTNAENITYFTTKPDNELVTEEVLEETKTTELLTDYPEFQNSTTLGYTTDAGRSEITQNNIEESSTDEISTNNSTEVTESWTDGNMTAGTTQRPVISTTEETSAEKITEDTSITTEGTTKITTAISTTEDMASSVNVTAETHIPDISTTQDLTAATQSPVNTTEESITTTQAPICPVGVFGNVPHPDRCDAYFLCSGGAAFEVTCSSGFEFDPITTECVEITEGGCTLGPIGDNENESSNSTTIELPTTENITDEIMKETQTTELLTGYPGAHGSTTQRYTTADSVGEVTQDKIDVSTIDELSTSHTDSWTSDKMPDSTTQIPNNPTESVENTSPEETIEEHHVTTEGTTLTNEVTIAIYTTEDVGPNDILTQSPDASTTQAFPIDESYTTTPEPICPAGMFGNVPHPERCDAYFLCSGGFAFEVLCSTGFEFNTELQECVEISEGGCTLGSDTTQENIETFSTTIGNINSKITTEIIDEAIEAETTRTDTTDATWDIQVPDLPQPIQPPVNPGTDNPNEEPTEILTEEDADGNGPRTEIYVITTMRNDLDEGVTDETTTLNSSVTVPICPDGVFGNIPHDSRCDAYYLCSAGMAFEVLCPSGFEFNLDSKTCVEIAEGGCTLNSNNLKIMPVLYGNNRNTVFGHKADRIQNICEQNSMRDIPHEQLCNSFYKCRDGQALQLFCSEGFEFEPRLKKCVPITGNGCTAHKMMS